MQNLIVGIFLALVGGSVLGAALGAFPMGAFPLTGQGLACACFFYVAPMLIVGMGLAHVWQGLGQMRGVK